MSNQTNKDVVERFDAILDNQRLDELDVLCTPGMVNHTLAPGRPPGLDGTREFLSNAPKLFQGDGWTECRVFAEGDFVVQYGVRAGRWLGGSFLGVDAPVGDYVRDFAAMYRLEGGRIAERWAVRDDLGMLRQLGAL